MLDIEAKACADADARIFDPPLVDSADYWEGAQQHKLLTLYCAAHAQRIRRMNGNGVTG